MSNGGSNIWLFLEMIARRRGLIIGLVLVATLVSVVVSLVLPEWYTATALLLPPPEDSARGGLNYLSRIDLYTGGTRFPGMVTPNDVYARMLRSRNIADRIIDQFNLEEYYGTKKRSALYLTLHERAKIKVTDEGLLSVSVEDKDPKMAAELATAFVQELIDLNSEILSTSAREKREFIEARLKDVSTQLDAAREELKQFQLKNRAVDLDEQTRLAIEQAVNLKVQQANLELDIRLGEEVMGRNNPELIEKRKRLDALSQQLEQIEQGGGNDSSFFSLPVAEIPGLKGQLESLYARVKVNESLYETLLDLYEQARIQEQEDTPTIAVLDWPAVPDLRSRPQRRVIVLGTFVVSIILAVFLAGVLEFIRRVRINRPEDYQRLLAFADAYFGWLPGVRKKKRD
jgi:uncharacterized protein involved in exopolysaccharide biosynthesis